MPDINEPSCAKHKVWHSISSTLSLDTCLRLIADKKINVLKYIDDYITLDKAQEAFERLTNGNDDAIKIIFKPNN